MCLVAESGWADAAERTREALNALADPERAEGMRRYLKNVAPCLGIPAATRRRVQRDVWSGLPQPSPEQLWAAVDHLVGASPDNAYEYREHHYAAIDLLSRFRRVVSAEDLPGNVRDLLLLRPWWDTVDDLGSKAVNPLVRANPQLVDVMWRWNAETDQWLIRASVQHQRGRGEATDIPLLIAMCEPHARDRRFFVAKAIGWALRDVCRIPHKGKYAVQHFLASHPELPTVARREAQRGLARAGDSL